MPPPKFDECPDCRNYKQDESICNECGAGEFYEESESKENLDFQDEK